MLIVSLITVFIVVGLWEYCTVHQTLGVLPYSSGFNTFVAFVQWPFIAALLIRMFGWGYGILATLFCVFLLQYITHFTIGILFDLVLTKAFRAKWLYGALALHQMFLGVLVIVFIISLFIPV